MNDQIKSPCTLLTLSKTYLSFIDIRLSHFPMRKFCRWKNMHLRRNDRKRLKTKGLAKLIDLLVGIMYRFILKRSSPALVCIRRSRILRRFKLFIKEIILFLCIRKSISHNAVYGCIKKALVFHCDTQERFSKFLIDPSNLFGHLKKRESRKSIAKNILSCEVRPLRNPTREFSITKFFHDIRMKTLGCRGYFFMHGHAFFICWNSFGHI